MLKVVTAMDQFLHSACGLTNKDRQSASLMVSRFQKKSKISGPFLNGLLPLDRGVLLTWTRRKN